MKKQEFEDKYLNKMVEVKLFDDDIFKGYLYSTNDYMKQTNRLDNKNYYFVGRDIRENSVRFRKSHIKKIRLLSCLNINYTFKVGELDDDEIKEILDYWKFYINEPNNYKLLNVHFDKIKKVLDYITNLQQLEQEHQRINGELREENNKLEIALQNIQEDYNKRIKEIDVLKKKLDRRYYKNEYERLKQENERLKELNKNASKVCMAEHRYGVDKAEEARDYKSRCEKASEKLGNYKHYSTPTEEQNSENEDIVDSALNILQNGGENDGD